MTFNLENKKELKEDIYLFEDFLTEEECEAIIKYWDHSVEKGTLPWQGISFYESYAYNMPNQLTDDKNKDVIKRFETTNIEYNTNHPQYKDFKTNLKKIFEFLMNS